MTAVVIIDLNSLGVPIWMTSTSDPNPDAASIRIVERVRALTSGIDWAAIALDCPPYFRKDVMPEYKAHRPPTEAPMRFQINKAADTLRADGYAVLGVRGFEADDIAATLVHRILAENDVRDILIVSSDKDLCALVGPRVSLKSVKDGSVIDEAAVTAKFGVPPSKMLDLLTLWGDSSDGVKGADKVGQKIGSSLLAEFGSIDEMFKAFDAGATPTMTPNLRTRLQEFRPRVELVRSVIRLRSDVPIDNFDDIFKPRVPVDDVAVFGEFGDVGLPGGVADEWPMARQEKAEDMLNRPTPEQIAESREAAKSMFEPGPTQTFRVSGDGMRLTPVEARAEIDAAMPPMPKPCICADPENCTQPIPGYICKNKTGATNAAREANAEDRPPGSAVVRDDALRREVGDRPGDQHANTDADRQGGARDHRSDPTPLRPDAERAVGGQGAAIPAGGHVTTALTPVVVDYERALEPKDLGQAYKLAQSMFQARLFSNFGNADAVLSVILAGREFGIQAMASLRSFHVLDGKPTLSSGLTHALVIKSGKAKYFRCTERTAERATFETQRGEDPPMRITYSVEDARRGWTKGEDSFKKSGWGRVPEDMCVARALSKLARLVYPDVLAGVYSSEEFDQ